MSQIATSIEQSKRLLEAGVSKESADMMWEQHYDNNPYLTIQPRTTLGRSYGAHAIVSWSLSSLWQMVYELDRTYEFPTELSADELMETLVCTIVYRKTH